MRRLAQTCRTTLSAVFLAMALMISAPAEEGRSVIRYANLMGGSDSDKPAAVTTDAAGYIYITGQTTSADFPITKRFAAPHAPSFYSDIFVVKIDPSGGAIVYSVIVGAGQPAAIVVDRAGSVYVAGAESAS